MTILSKLTDLIVVSVVVVARGVDICEFRLRVATTLALAFDIRGSS